MGSYKITKRMKIPVFNSNDFKIIPEIHISVFIYAEFRKKRGYGKQVPRGILHFPWIGLV